MQRTSASEKPPQRTRPTPVEVTVNNPEPNIHFEAVMPEQKFEQPVVNIEVQPAEVKVMDNHPRRAVQTVERNEDDEIVRTLIDYERDDG